MGEAILGTLIALLGFCAAFVKWLDNRQKRLESYQKSTAEKVEAINNAVNNRPGQMPIYDAVYKIGQDVGKLSEAVSNNSNSINRLETMIEKLSTVQSPAGFIEDKTNDPESTI